MKIDEYKLGTKEAFWTTIWKLLKEHTKYDFVELRNIVVCWVTTCINKLIEEDIESDIQVDQDNFKAAVEVFRNW